MKQSMKNLIMIGMAVILVGTSAITFRYASSGTGHMPQMNGMPQFEQRGDFGNQNQGENPVQDFGNGKQDGNNQQTPPDTDSQPTPPNGKQDGKNDRQMPDGNNGTDGKSDSNQQNDSNDNKSDSNSAQQKGTSAESSELTLVSTAQQNNAPSNGSDQVANNNTQSTESTAMQGFYKRGFSLNIVEKIACYIFAAIQIGIIIMILLYLAFSEFNKLSYKQTVAKLKK